MPPPPVLPPFPQPQIPQQAQPQAPQSQSLPQANGINNATTTASTSSTFTPALHLYPLNDSFVPKQIALAPQSGKVKIGRQTNAKTVPGERNGYFDSKVLSRQHAEIWEDGGKIFIRDVKSSNGTFINGERLSAEGIESEPFELKTDDTVEFGIDIVGEDNKTIIHHKVAAKVVVVLSPDDLVNLPIHHQTNNRRSAGGGQLIPAVAPHSALGGMGGAPRAKSGLTFEHILARLQTELSKSRETGNDLTNLSGVMNDIQETLSGAVPANLPSYPAVLPPVRPHNPDQPPVPQAPPPVDPTVITTIQTQLQDTQSNLQEHDDKLKSVEGIVAEQETLKRDFAVIKDQMEERKREVEILLMQRRGGEDDDSSSHFSRRRNVHPMSDDDDDDARSVATIRPDDDDDDEHNRPRTPEPTGHLSDDEYEVERQKQAKLSSIDPATSEIALLATRLESLTQQLDSALELSKTLQHQASAAQTTIASLEAKVGTLEAFVLEQKEKARPSSPVEVVTKSVWEEWRERVEGSWKSERESWVDEKDRLRDAVKEWQKRTGELERKEEERAHKEDHEILPSKYDDSSSSSDEDAADERGPTLVNGFSPSPKPRHSTKNRRRKSHVKGSISNSITILPSPMSSPTSSSSMYPSSRSHTRRSTSPSSVEPNSSSSDPPHHLGKLPISPPNTSPRSRPESLVHEVEVKEEENEGEEGLGLVNPLPNGNGNPVGDAPAEDLFGGNIHSFAHRNGLGADGPGFKQIFGNHPMSYISAASVVVISAVAWTVVNRERP